MSMIKLFCFFNLVWSFHFAKAEEAKASPSPVFKIGASLDSRLDLFFLPTAQRGHLAFDTTELRLKIQGLLPENATESKRILLQYDLLRSKVIEGALKLERSAAVNAENAETGANATGAANAERRGIQDSLTVGIVRRPFLQELSELEPQSKLGSLEFFPLARKYNYEDESDKGLVLQRRQQGGPMSFALGVLNGEGAEQKEAGGGKDIEAVVTYKLDPYAVVLGYELGVYDAYSGSETRKERIEASMQYQREMETWAIEVLYANDPAQAIEDRQIAEHVDLTAKAGEKIYGLAYRLSYFRKISDLWGGILQVDTLRPDLSDSKKDFWEATLAATYRWTDAVHFWAGLSQAGFPEEHSASIRDQQRFSIAMRVEF